MITNTLLGNDTIEDEIDKFYEISDDIGHYICQSNHLVNSKQDLKLNSMKLIRIAIMQIQKDDVEIKPYVIPVKKLADLMGTTVNYVYKNMNSIIRDTLKSQIFFAEEGKKIKDTAMLGVNWVSSCSYEPGVGLKIKLNNDLKRYLIGLKEKYEQYPYENIIGMKSTYSIRMFEIIQSNIYKNLIPKNGVDVIIPVSHLKECLDCEKKYAEFKEFKKIIIRSLTEINVLTLFAISYEPIKEGREVSKIKFHVNMQYH